ncbi:hypothetical protein BKA82DRAFT_813594 [Pisolithus tinctorius]|uniref:Heterokaryon incompatibility domain-containing protein n=1 Tax=Pisolithus tinctorius Marx 270 TaxID=870435 RepID=A0A0C3IR68_PISTI|nr:hypothetical protein BKA82DRAFT_813594 [Pisolithus tinctorius]KIN99412.1 hypothetical protein M404DRAFT_813594 [Pisolithus tinctorius Marx 270]
MSQGKRTGIRGRARYKKIIDTCREAQKGGLEWVWIDTCCIDRKSDSEVSKAINSMCRWYENVERCYPYMMSLATLGRMTKSRRQCQSGFREAGHFRSSLRRRMSISLIRSGNGLATNTSQRSPDYVLGC